MAGKSKSDRWAQVKGNAKFMSGFGASEETSTSFCTDRKIMLVTRITFLVSDEVAKECNQLSPHNHTSPDLPKDSVHA